MGIPKFMHVYHLVVYVCLPVGLSTFILGNIYIHTHNTQQCTIARIRTKCGAYRVPLLFGIWLNCNHYGRIFVTIK